MLMEAGSIVFFGSVICVRLCICEDKFVSRMSEKPTSRMSPNFDYRRK